MSNIYLKVTIEKNWRSQNFVFLSDSNEIRTHNHLVRKRTLNHLAKLVNWLSCVVNTYVYGACDCMLLSRHVRVLEWIRFSKFKKIVVGLVFGELQLTQIS